MSFDTEPDYDFVIVEAHVVGSDAWTTLPEAGGLTTTAVPADCDQGFLLEEHPFLLKYLTLGDAGCTATGTTGAWNAMTGSSGGWKPVTFDLSAYAGQQVEVSISFVTDSAVSGIGVVVDDTEVVVGGAPVQTEGFETGLGAWAPLDPPPGSPTGGSAFERSDGLLASAVTTEDSVLLGFGLEQIATAGERADVVRRAHAGISSGGPEYRRFLPHGVTMCTDVGALRHTSPRQEAPADGDRGDHEPDGVQHRGRPRVVHHTVQRQGPGPEVQHGQGLGRHPTRAEAGERERAQHHAGAGEADEIDEVHADDSSRRRRQREVTIREIGVQSDCMQISPDRLLILRAVAASGGVGAAARELHLAPSGISQHLARLERETGLVLVDRFHSGGQRPLRLTAAGQRLAAHGARLAEVLADVAEDVYAMSQRLSGTANLGAFASVMTRLVVPAIHDLEQRAPGVQVRVHEAGEPQALSALRGGELDVVIVEDENLLDRDSRTGLAHTWLLDDPYRVAVPAAWPVPRSLDDLASRPWISGPPGTAVHLVLDRVRRTSGLALTATHECEEFAAVLALVEAGFGASVVPALALAVEDPPGLRLVGLPEFGARHISAVTVATRRPPPMIIEVLHALVEVASGR